MDKFSDDMDGTATRLDVVQVRYSIELYFSSYFWRPLSRLPVEKLFSCMLREQVL